VESIDGRRIQEWIEVAKPLVIRGSASLVQSQLTGRYLSHLQYLRERMGLEQKPSVEVEFVSAAGRSRVTRTFPVAERLPIVDDRWPAALHKHQGSPYRILGDIGYLRLDGMYGEPKASVLVDEAMARLRHTRGLIVDVRGNTGGSTDVLHALLPYLMAPNEAPQVVMAARFRLGSRHDPDFPGWLMRGDSPRWTARKRGAIERFQGSFTPEWIPPEDQFSEWFYEVVDRADNPDAHTYPQPVVVVQDGNCFSATDVFLSALKGRPNITLLGVPSAGGSGNSATYELCVDWWCTLSTHVGFQANGLLFDGRGIDPDVRTEPTPEYFIGQQDNLLDAAIARLAISDF
jgi:C-terminal processing protease CtpA/Prc